MIRFDRVGFLVAAALLSAACEQWLPRSSPAGDGTGSPAPAAAGQKAGGARAGGGSGGASGSGATHPAPAPRPAPRRPGGTTIPVTLETALSSATSSAGDLAVARVSSDVVVAEKVVVPAGTEMRGRVTTAVRSGKVKGRAHLAVQFDQLVLHGREQAIETRPIDITAKAQKKRDGAMLAGGAG